MIGKCAKVAFPKNAGAKDSSELRAFFLCAGARNRTHTHAHTLAPFLPALYPLLIMLSYHSVPLHLLHVCVCLCVFVCLCM